MTLGDVIAVVDRGVTEIDLWGIDPDTGNPFQINEYHDVASYERMFSDCKVVEISAATGGLLDVTIDYAVSADYNESDEVIEGGLGLFPSASGGACTASSCDIKASDDSYEDDEDEWEDDMYFDMDEFFLIAEEVWAELGIYLDLSSVRYNDGTVFIYADPDQENNADIWLGDIDDELVSIDFPEYQYHIQKIMRKPQSQWKDLYKKYLESEIHNQN